MAKKPVAKTQEKAATPEVTEITEPALQPKTARPVYCIPLSKIVVPQRLRQVDEDHATAIADSMAVNDQQTPIEVSQKDAQGVYTLITGAHRLRAAQINNWTTIEALIFLGSPQECRLREIDENLIRRELSPLDQAVFLAERKKIYEELYPESRAGAAGAAARWHASAKLAFASDAAEKCGISERSVDRAVMRFNRIAPDVRGRIALTWIAGKGTELDALAKLEPEEQRKAIDLLFSGNEDAPKSVLAASKVIRNVREQASNGDDRDADFKAFTRKWSRGIYSAQTKRNIIAWLEAEGHLAGPGEDGEQAEAA